PPRRGPRDPFPRAGRPRVRVRACRGAPGRSGAPRPARRGEPASRRSGDTPRPAGCPAPQGPSAALLASLLVRGSLAGSGRRRGGRGGGLRRLEQDVEQLAVARQQQHGLVVAKDSLIFLQLLEKRIELDILAVGLVADTVGFGVRLPLERLFACVGLGERVTIFALRVALDIRGQALPLALIVRHLLLPFAADAVEDGIADGHRVAGPAQADVHEVDAVVVAGPLLEADAGAAG